MTGKCRRTPEYCRKIKSGGRAKRPCTRDGQLGTRVRTFYSPKGCQNNSSATRIQALIRGGVARIKSRKSGKSKQSAATRLQAALRGHLSRKKSGSGGIPFADSIKAGHAKVRVGEKFKTTSGTYLKTASKPTGYKKL